MIQCECLVLAIFWVRGDSMFIHLVVLNQFPVL
jgi:hypothetical protein